MALGRITARSATQRTLLVALAVCGLAALSSPPAAAQTPQVYQEAIDYAKLRSRVPSNAPTGAGGLVSMVEGTDPFGASFVDGMNPEFEGTFDPYANNDPFDPIDPREAVSLTPGSGQGMTQSNHALGVARHFFGDLTSIAPGVNDAVLFEASHWLTYVLRYDVGGGIDDGQEPTPPRQVLEPPSQTYMVQNHSYIVPSLGTTARDRSALRRFDWLVENYDVTEVVGANNAASLVAHPNLLVHSYNAIVVGRTDGLHSRGATNSVYGVGRYKPDIVAPLNFTSHTTPVVGSAAALLHETGAGTDAVRSETIKATLLAGATKQEFAGFLDPLNALAPNPWDRTPTRPLDDVFGAGELNVYNNHLIQLGGEHDGSETEPTIAAGSYGWDYKAKTAANEQYYNFQIAAGSTATELSIILAWNAKVTDSNSAASIFTPSESLQNLDLQLYDSSSVFLDVLLDESVSTVDNVEHIYQTDLGPGTYTLKVTGAADWDYGLAWRMTTAFDEISADFDEDGVVDGADFLAWQRNLGKLLGAMHAEGDADGDGDVDMDDLNHLRNGVLPASPAVAHLAVQAIPEPTAVGLAAGALLAALGWRGRRRRR